MNLLIPRLGLLVISVEKGELMSTVIMSCFIIIIIIMIKIMFIYFNSYRDKAPEGCSGRFTKFLIPIVVNPPLSLHVCLFLTRVPIISIL